ncbi:MAG: UDP-N-acetylmuramoyl-L-alanine--D-glutamate ligase [Planctomycetota bacterium]|nr:UDP-N-acetylmuramoyl-L-alanine--D-glutamate ligase [Planctomycetota bacterium]
MSTVGQFNGKRVVVAGLGRFGGGIGVTRWLCKQGARVVVTDRASRDDLSESITALEGLPVEYQLGGHDESALDQCDLLSVSPAVDKAHSEFFQAAVLRGVPWTSEMNLFLERCPARLVGITGTVGKSTTTAMLGTVLDAAKETPSWSHGRVWLGGNIGKSLLDDLPDMNPDDVVVLELSSFQLEDAAAIRKSPDIALITNIRDNHLDRHGTMASYAAAKANIYRYQRKGGLVVLPLGLELPQELDDARSRLPRWGYAVEPDGRTIRIESVTAARRNEFHVGGVSLAVPGPHNIANAAAALTLSRILGVDDDTALSALASFTGLPHRLEFVREFEGVCYYNDSKATTPEAAITALRAIDRPVVMIVGGSDKGISFVDLAVELGNRAKAVVCLGATRERIAADVRAAVQSRNGPKPQTVCVGGFAEAVTAARGFAERGDVVLLSPACASFDMFKNYEKRGDAFRSIVASWTRSPPNRDRQTTWTT